MQDFIITKLNKLGYRINSKAQEIIEECNEWYRNDIIDGFHDRQTVNGVTYTMERTGFGKRACEDDANLCEIVSVQSNDESVNTFVTDFLEESKFAKNLREQLELIAAEGTAGAYIRVHDADIMDDGTLRGGRIEIMYAEPRYILPLTVKNKNITECAFVGVDIVDNKKRTTLTVFDRENDVYHSKTFVFNEYGREYKEKALDIMLGEIKPFSVLTTAKVNNLKDMQGYGYPKIYSSIPTLKGIDLIWNVLFGDLDKGEKMVLYNEALCQFDSTGNPITPNKMHKRVFVPLGSKLPDEKDLIKEINPEIRIDDITKTFELLLSFLSMSFGYGTRKYSFENGQIKTATEYMGTKQDSMQELNKQRANLTEYIQTIIRSALWFSNAFLGTAYNVDAELDITYDDSYITDTESELESMRNDAQMFGTPKLTIRYFMKRYDIDEKEATAWFEDSEEPPDDETNMV